VGSTPARSSEGTGGWWSARRWRGSPVTAGSRYATSGGRTFTKPSSILAARSSASTTCHEGFAMRSYSLPRHSKPPFSTIPRAEERLRPLRLRPSAFSKRTRRWGRCSRRSGSGSATRGPVGMTSTSVQAVMKTRTTPLLVSGLKDHLTGEVLGVISRIRAASSRYRLTPLSAQHAETAGNREQRNPLR
jgi:hypothetical protein